MRSRGLLIAALIAGVLLQGGLLNSWWPLGWAPPLYLTIIVLSAWWMPILTHAEICLTGAIFLDDLLGDSTFPATKFTLILLLVTFLLKWWGIVHSERQLAGVLLVWATGWLVWSWQAVAALNLSLIFFSCVQTIITLAAGWWLIKHLGEPSHLEIS